MEFLKRFAAGVALALLVVGITAMLPVQTQPQPASAQQAGDKYDGDCTGNETDGRCADKCPPPTAEGAYFERGRDKDGKISCGFAFYNECPYATGYSATDPMCEKLKPTPEQLEPWQPEATAPAPTETNQCGGK